MRPRTTPLTVSSKKAFELIKITDQVRAFVKETDVKDGLVTIMSRHSTTSICINESCKALEIDLYRFLKKLTETEQEYEHDKAASDGRSNAHSHLLAFLMGCQQTIPIIDGKMTLGTWQEIFFLELDGPRPHREIVLNVWGDSG